LSTIELTYTGRERSFVTWSAILGYAFDFYNLIIMAFLLTQIQRLASARSMVWLIIRRCG
jgi:hypothetical protein